MDRNSVADWFRHTSDPEWAEAQSGEHAEMTAISGARSLGLTPSAGVTTNIVCAECAVEIHKMGGWLTAGRNFVFGR